VVVQLKVKEVMALGFVVFITLQRLWNLSRIWKAELLFVLTKATSLSQVVRLWPSLSIELIKIKTNTIVAAMGGTNGNILY